MIEKHEYDVNAGPTLGASDDSLSDRHQGTYHDVRDMGRLGKKQEFMVHVAQKTLQRVDSNRS